MKHQVDHRKVDHGFAAGGEHFIVFAHSPVSPDPSEGALDDPSPGKHREADDVIASLDNLQHPTTHGLRPFDEFTRIPSVCPNELQSRVQSTEFAKHKLGTVTILNMGSMDDHGQDQAQRIDDQVPLAPLDFLACVVPSRPPFSVVLTVWLSTMAAEGEAFRPAAKRTFLRRAS